MKFSESPKLFIHKYYEDKINQIDFKCEKEILEIEQISKQDIKQELLRDINELRQNLIDKIKLVKEEVLQRYEVLEPKCTKKLLQMNSKMIQDEIFLDKYCVVIKIHQFYPLFDLKFGTVLFSEFNDELLINFK